MVDCFVEFLKDWKINHPKGWIIKAEDWNKYAITDHVEESSESDTRKDDQCVT